MLRLKESGFTAVFDKFKTREWKITSVHWASFQFRFFWTWFLSLPAWFPRISGEAEIGVPRLPSGGRNEYSSIYALWRPQVEAEMW